MAVVGGGVINYGGGWGGVINYGSGWGGVINYGSGWGGGGRKPVLAVCGGRTLHNGLIIYSNYGSSSSSDFVKFQR